MTSTAEVKATVKASLEQSGALSQLRAKLREEVTKTIVNGAAEDKCDASVTKPTLSNENLLINELIR